MGPREERLVNELERQRALVQKLLGQIDDLTETVAIRDATIATLTDEVDELEERLAESQDEVMALESDLRDTKYKLGGR
jgi:chromosome segregation ATPase